MHLKISKIHFSWSPPGKYLNFLGESCEIRILSRSIQEIFFYRVENTKIFRLISWSIINPSNCKYQTIKLDCLYSIHPSIKEMVNLLSSIVLRTTWSKVLAQLHFFCRVHYSISRYFIYEVLKFRPF